jgi:ankyrin repeat protein
MFNSQWSACLLLLVAQLVSAGSPAMSEQWIQAIAQRNTSELRQLLPLVDDINLQDREGKTALMVAAVKGDNVLLRQLLHQGGLVDMTNHRGGTALMYAAAKNHVPVAQTLILHHANTNVRAENGWTALILAAAKGNDEMVHFLLNHGANPNIPDVYGWTALMRAIQHKRYRVMNELLESDQLNIDRINNKGQSALHIAALEQDCRSARLLLDHGANSRLLDFRQRPISVIEDCKQQ